MYSLYQLYPFVETMGIQNVGIMGMQLCLPVGTMKLLLINLTFKVNPCKNIHNGHNHSITVEGGTYVWVFIFKELYYKPDWETKWACNGEEDGYGRKPHHFLSIAKHLSSYQ